MPYLLNIILNLIFICIISSGCAVVIPTRYFEATTPIDTGLAGTYLSTAIVLPFEAPGDEEWGVYAARRMSDYLAQKRAFRKVDFAAKKTFETNYIITGTIDRLYYGGSDTPTTAFISVKVVSTADSQVHFYRTAKASSKQSAFHMTWLRGVDVPSPCIEEVLNNMLENIAKDISKRTSLPAVQNP